MAIHSTSASENFASSVTNGIHTKTDATTSSHRTETDLFSQVTKISCLKSYSISSGGKNTYKRHGRCGLLACAAMMVVLTLLQQWKNVRQATGSAQELQRFLGEEPLPLQHAADQPVLPSSSLPQQSRGVLHVLWDELEAQNPTTSNTQNGTILSTISSTDKKGKKKITTTPTWNNLAKNTRVLANVVPRLSIIPQDAITLITHVSTSKLDKLILLQEFWGGPLSVAVWIKAKDDVRVFYSFLEHQATPALLEATSFHVWMEYQPEPYYPHNKLRNLALRHSDSDFFMTNDADIITKPNSYRELMALMEQTAPPTSPNRWGMKQLPPEVKYDPNTAGTTTPLSFGEAMKHRALFVVPAFERHLPDGSNEVTADMLPRTKQELQQMRKAKLITEFYGATSKIQGPTQYHIWHANQTDWYYPITYKTQYEPYVIGYKHGVPLHGEAFRGFGWNKQSWLREMGNHMNYRFYVLRDFFIVHRNHASVRKMGTEQNRNRPVWLAFQQYLEKRYWMPNDKGQVQANHPNLDSDGDDNRINNVNNETTPAR